MVRPIGGCESNGPDLAVSEGQKRREIRNLNEYVETLTIDKIQKLVDGTFPFLVVPVTGDDYIEDRYAIHRMVGGHIETRTFTVMPDEMLRFENGNDSRHYDFLKLTNHIFEHWGTTRP